LACLLPRSSWSGGDARARSEVTLESLTRSVARDVLRRMLADDRV